MSTAEVSTASATIAPSATGVGDAHVGDDRGAFPARSTVLRSRSGPTARCGVNVMVRLVETTQPSGSAASPAQKPPTLSHIVSSAPVRMPPLAARADGRATATSPRR